MSAELIRNSLKYYDKWEEKYKHIKDKIRYIKVLDKDDAISAAKNPIDRRIIVAFLDDNENELFRSRIEALGMYQRVHKTWVWGWAVPYLSKKYTTIIKKVLLYGTEIYVDSDMGEDLRDLKSTRAELITSRFKVTNDAQIDTHVAIASYLSKVPFTLRSGTLYIAENSHGKKNYIDLKAERDMYFYLFIIDPPPVEN